MTTPATVKTMTDHRQPISEQDVLYVAELANLELTADERARMVKDLNSILDYVDRYCPGLWLVRLVHGAAPRNASYAAGRIAQITGVITGT